MESFGTQLSAARKAKGFTQEQLAEKLSVSRTNISRWESGKLMPDFETIRKLSEILEVNFFSNDEPAKPEIVSETKPAEVPEIPETPPTKPAKRFPIAIAISAASLCIILLVGIFLNGHRSKPQANVVITPSENPTYAIESAEYFPEAGKGWFYEFNYEETAGVPFTVSQAVITTIGDDDLEYNQYYTGDEVATWFEGSATLEKDAPHSAMGGFPIDDVKGVRVTLSGTDANGNDLSFSGYVELSKEVQE